MLIPGALDESAYAIRQELGGAVEWVQGSGRREIRTSFLNELRWVHLEVPRLLARRAPDAETVLMPYHAPPLIARGVRRVVFLHDLCGLGDGFPKHKKAYWRHYVRLRAAAHTADVILPISQSTRDEMAQRFGASRRRLGPVVHNGVHRAAVPNSQLAEVLAAYGLERTGYVVGFATRQVRKNFAATLGALSELRRSGETVRLVGIAPPGEVEDMRAWCRATGHDDAIILTQVSAHELDGLYAGALALLWPSTCEGFGYPVVEAMRQGCPPLVWAFGPGAEMLPDALRPVSSPDPMQLADRVRELRRQPSAERTQLEVTLQEHSLAFSLDAYTERLRDALLHVAART